MVFTPPAAGPLHRIRQTLTDPFIRLRICYRQNPGFVMAAAAGSIGLVLAVILLFGGGGRLLGLGGGDGAENTVAENDEADLGPAAGDDDEYFGKVALRQPDRRGADPFAGKGAKDQWEPDDDSSDDELDHQPIARRKTDAHSESAADRRPAFGEDDDDNDTAPLVASNRSKTARLVEPRRTESAFGDDEESSSKDDDDDAGSKPLAIKPKAKTPAFDADSEDDADETDATEAGPRRPPLLKIAPVEEESETGMEADSEAEESAPTRSKPAEERKEPASPRRPRLFGDDEAESGGDALPPAKNAKSRGNDPFADDKPTKFEKPSRPAIEPEPEGDVEPAIELERTVEPAAVPATQKFSATKRRPESNEAAPAGETSPAATTIILSGGEETRESRPRQKSVPVVERSRDTAAARNEAPIRLEISAPEAARPGQLVDLKFTVRNAGDVALENLVLTVELPAGLNHRDGPALDQKIAALPAGATHRGVLTVRAVSSGEQTARGRITAAGKIAARAAATIGVSATAKIPSREKSACLCAPLR